MRILFVSGTAVGGSVRSTRELAELLATRGHPVALLVREVGGPRRNWLHKRATNLAAKVGEPWSRPVAALASLIGRRPQPGIEHAEVPTWTSILPENSLAAVRRRFRPDVVVVSSIERTAWRRIRAELARAWIPSVLYLREDNALGHLRISHAAPDLLLSNAHAHAEQAEELAFPAVTIPSVVSVDDCLVDTTRRRVLLINPVELYGVDIALALAEARPDVPFVLREWWHLTAAQRTELEAAVRRLPNVELLPPTTDARALYGDASVVLAPHRTNGRSRVMLEAQANGIPVLATDLPALREAVGPGGLVVPADAPESEWLAALSELLDDRQRYERYVDAAREHAARDEVDPEAIVTRFETVVGGLLARREPSRSWT